MAALARHSHPSVPRRLAETPSALWANRIPTNRVLPAAQSHKPAFDRVPIAGNFGRDFTQGLNTLNVEHGTGRVVLSALSCNLLSHLFARMRSESDGDLRPGSSLTAESSTTAHSTATHKHKSPMRRLMNGLKRLNSYSNDNSDSSSSDDGDDDDDDRKGSSDSRDGGEEFVERHRVQEIRFNYESWPICFTYRRDL